MSAKLHNALHNQTVLAHVVVAYPQTSVGSVLPSGRRRDPWGGIVLNIDVGLRPLQPEAVCLMPVIQVRCEPDYVLITLAGEVDFAAVASLRERLFALATRGRPMVADLDQVSFIDAAGLGVLAGAARPARRDRGSLYAGRGR